MKGEKEKNALIKKEAGGRKSAIVYVEEKGVTPLSLR